MAAAALRLDALDARVLAAAAPGPAVARSSRPSAAARNRRARLRRSHRASEPARGRAQVRAEGRVRTLVTPVIMFNMCEHAERIDADSFVAPNHFSTLTVLSSTL